MIEASPGITVQKLCKEFGTGDASLQAIVDVTLSITNPGITALMGPSGSGKSTLLNLLGALDSPTSGKVIIQGVDLASLNLTQRAQFRNRTCGFIFQNFNLIPVLTTLENVMLPAQLNRMTDIEQLVARATALLETVGLNDQAHQSVNRLSGGQQQRVAVARSLINDPHLILADEPTANLDQANSSSIMNLLKSVSSSAGKIIVMATHDHSVLPYCDRIINMRDGRIISDELTS